MSTADTGTSHSLATGAQVLRALLLALLLGGALVDRVALAAPAGERASADSGESAQAAAMAVLDAFMTAFNARDMAAWEATLNFPHFRLADGTLTVLDRAGTRSPKLFDALARTGWDHSAWLSRSVVQSGPDKVHIATVFARYRADGSELARYQSLYVVTREQGHWGIRGRSSFAP